MLARAKIASLHVISEIWLLLQCAVALQRADALAQQTTHLHKCDHVKKKITGGGGVVRLTAKPRYLLLLHRGNEKSNTVTALGIGVFLRVRVHELSIGPDTVHP